MEALRRDLERETYEVEIVTRTREPMASAFVKFRGLLHELDLSPHEDEVLGIRVKIDCNPPAGARTQTRLVRRFVMLNLLHHDRASLLAGKLHAVLSREYTKGRDLYDLVWYLSDPAWPSPNLLQLNNALEQTGWDGPRATPESWRALVRARLEEIDWQQARRDVSPFLERSQDVSLVSDTTLLPLLESGRPEG
jgi:hypothetical protein